MAHFQCHKCGGLMSIKTSRKVQTRNGEAVWRSLRCTRKGCKGYTTTYEFRAVDLRRTTSQAAQTRGLVRALRATQRALDTALSVEKLPSYMEHG